MINQEIRNRIKLSVAAYAYEMEDDSIMSDADFDSLCREIKVNESTGNEKMDNFFKTEFNPSTGQWIHQHPELDKIKIIYNKYYKSS
jgi:NAD-dependent DNA ligase